MKRESRSICISVIACGLAATALGAPTQLNLLNPSFEDGTSYSDVTNWTVSAGQAGRMQTYVCDSTTISPHSGGYFMINDSHWDGDVGVFEQTLATPLAPGVHNLALSFWAYVYDDGVYPSVVAGELIVDGEVVASANKTSEVSGASSSWQQVWATWSGPVAFGEVKVRFTLVGDGAGNWGVAALDDVAIWDCTSGTCTGQHEVTNIEPNMINTPAPSTQTVSVYGTSFGANMGDLQVYLWKTFAGSWIEGGLNPSLPNDLVINGTPNGINPDGSLSVTFPTSGQTAGVFDLVVAKAGSNPVVISNAFEILDTGVAQNLLANPSFEVVNETVKTQKSHGVPAPIGEYNASVGNAAIWLGEYYKNFANVVNPHSIDNASFFLPVSNPPPSDSLTPCNGTWSNSVGGGGSTTNTLWQTVPVAAGTPLTFTGWRAINADSGSGGSVTITLHDGSETGAQIGGPAMPTGNMNGTYWTEVGTSATAGNSGYVTVKMVAQLTSGGIGSNVGVFADNFTLTKTPVAPLRPWVVTPTIGFTTTPVLTITGGSNLGRDPLNPLDTDHVTAVRLVSKASNPPTIVQGDIQDAASGPTKLVVKFNMPEGAAAGRFNLVIDKPGAPPANLEFGRIRRSNGSIGTNPPVNTMRYQPNVPATFVNIFNYVPPGTELLQNGDFELEGPKSTNANPVKFWTAAQGVPLGYNGNAPALSGMPAASPYGYGGTYNFASLCDGNAQSRRAYQIVVVPPRHPLTLTGVLAYTEIGNANNHFVRLRDGGPAGPVLAEKVLSGGGSVPWTLFSIQGTPSRNQVTVEWGRDYVSGSGSVGTFVDQLSLKHGPSQCSTTFWADADEDGDVDQADFAFFQACYTGENAYIPTPDTNNCSCFDVTGNGGNPDSRVGQADLAVFESCATGPGVPINYGCGL